MSRCFIVLAILAGFAGLTSVGIAVQEAASPSGQFPGREYQRAPTIFRATLAQTDRSNEPAENIALEIANLKEALKGDADDIAKEKVTKKIRDLLTTQYDEFLQDNERQIDQLQQRIDQLRKQLKLRQSSKEKMVDLELKRIINESNGLIWPGQARHFSVPLLRDNAIRQPYPPIR